MAAITTELADRRLMSLIEPLPYLKDANGGAILDTDPDALIKVVAIASGLGILLGLLLVEAPHQ